VCCTCNIDELSRLLEAGINVVTTRSEFARPESMETSVRERIEAACQRGKSSIHSTGSSPGFITEAMPLLLSSLQRQLSCLHVHEFADVSSRNSPQLLFEIMGFGQTPRPEALVGRAQFLSQSFGPSLHLVADALGLPLDEIAAHSHVANARRDITIAAGTITRGTVAAQRTTISGMRKGAPLLVFSANWYCSTDVEPAWTLRETGWRIEVQGDTPLDIDIRSPVPAERWAEVSPNLTAHRPVNAIAYVCAAAPGIRTTLDLPQIVADLSHTELRALT
jgi:hypothetical protein